MATPITSECCDVPVIAIKSEPASPTATEEYTVDLGNGRAPEEDADGGEYIDGADGIPDSIAVPLIFNQNDVNSEISKSMNAEGMDHDTNQAGCLVNGGAVDQVEAVSQLTNRKDEDGAGSSVSSVCSSLVPLTPNVPVLISRGPPHAAVASIAPMTLNSQLMICDQRTNSSARSQSSSLDENYVMSPAKATATVEGTALKSKESVRVEDALNYLDVVKLRFNNDSCVYNSFLDIMKDFKAQTIDTMAVINRVSNLFQGHPDLIEGFKVFLPQEHQFHSDEFGTPVRTQEHFQLSVVVQQYPLISHGGSKVPIPIRTVIPQDQVESFFHDVGLQNRNCPNAVGEPAIPRANAPGSSFSHGVREEVTVPKITPYQQAYPPSAFHPDGPFQLEEGMNSVTYNQALIYVNTIKNRLQPEKYKQFLEILNNYQREQRQRRADNLPAPESLETERQIFEKISALFEDQKDLLEEFVRYMPSSSPDAYIPVATPVQVPLVATPEATSPFIPMLSISTKGKNARSSRGRGRARTPTTNSTFIPHTCASSLDLDSRNDFRESGKGYRSKKPRLSKVTKSAKGLAANAGLMDACKRVLSPYRYRQLLKVVNLYFEDILTLAELFQSANDLLRKTPELLARFRNCFQNNDSAPSESSSDIDRSSTKSDWFYEKSPCFMELDHANCRRIGKNYCRIPDNCQMPKGFGRTRLCDEVLNDEWISVPSLTEVTTIAVSKKTPYEEIIHRCDEERFECDFLIQTNLEAIKYLELALDMLNEMPQKERDSFKFDDYCIGSRSTIHLRAVKRIYGEENSADIIEGLKNKPAVAIPVVLKRLKAKDEEWRKVQKEMNKVWREQIEQNYLKSLDHQGPNGNGKQARQ